MSDAIGITFVPFDPERHEKNHFFGAPVALPSFKKEFGPEVLFLGMIHLPDIASLDEDEVLPHEGYLYFFLDTSMGSRHLNPIVRWYKTEPTEIIDDFNDLLALEEYPGTNVPRGIEFGPVDEDDDGCKLLGVPCDWNYQNPPKHRLLLQISHFDEHLDFLPHLDGFTYIFFGPKGEEFDGAYGFYEYS